MPSSAIVPIPLALTPAQTLYLDDLQRRLADAQHGTKAPLIERAAIDKLIAEQNFSNSDRADPVTAAKIGRILGVDAIILGTITHYDYEDKVTGGGGTSFGGFGRASMSTKHDIKARVQIDARIVSTDSAEVLGAVQGAGEVAQFGVGGTCEISEHPEHVVGVLLHLFIDGGLVEFAHFR